MAAMTNPGNGATAASSSPPGIAPVQWHIGEPGRVGHWAIDPALDLADWTVNPRDVTPARKSASLQVV